MKDNDISNLIINKKAFNKKSRYKLCIGVLAATLAVGSIFGSGIVDNNSSGNSNNGTTVETTADAKEEEHFAEVYCNFKEYENLDDNEHVTFIKEDGSIVGYIDINNKGETSNLTVYLEPGKYCAINGTGRKETMIIFEVEDPNEEYTLDIDCNDGSMEIHQNNGNTKKL